MIQLAVVMSGIVMPIDRDQLAFRQQLLTAPAPFPAVQDYVLHMKFKPHPRYDTGLFPGLGDSAFAAALVGEIIPQTDVTLSGTAHKLDSLLGPASR